MVGFTLFGAGGGGVETFTFATGVGETRFAKEVEIKE